MSLLYLHIPFCRGRCDYCSFYSIVSPEEKVAARYIARLLRQLDGEKNHFAITGISTVYIGGGTPSTLSLSLMEELLAGIAETLDETPAEWTVELNPEGCTPELLALLPRYGVTRISLGVQSLDEKSRLYLGRCGSLGRTREALMLLGAQWPGELSLDFIRGLPTDVGIPLAEEMDRIPFAPRHISLYDLSLEPGTALSLREEKRDADEPRDEEPASLLRDIGLERYEVSNFARPGVESQHNIGYWEMEEYLGVGAGAASLILQAGKWYRRDGTENLDEFLARRPAPGSGFLQVTAEEFFIDHLIMGLRQIRGLDLDLIRRRFGRELTELLPRTTGTALDRGEAEFCGNRLRLTGRAFEFQNEFIRRAWREVEERNCFA